MSLLGTFFGNNHSAAQSTGSPVEVITYVASLASNPKEIDPILDGLRTITAKISPGQELSPADQSGLAKVYTELSDYLAKDDPLRTVSQKALREKVTGKFPDSSSRYPAFWDNLTTT
jgi:hypothetical protein